MSELAKLLPPLFPAEDHSLALDALTSFSITTADALLSTSSTPPHPSLPPQLFTRLKRTLATHLSAPSSSGAYLCESASSQRTQQPQRFSTSLEELDDHLGGGFGLGDVVEVGGTRQSARTVLVMYATLLHLLLHGDKRAAWLDTGGGGFDAFRCLAILRDVLIPRIISLGGSFANEETGQMPTAEELAISVLDRLAVTRVGKAGDALDVLVHETKVEKAEKLDWVVVDQVDALLGGVALAGSSAQGQASLVSFFRRLSSLAQSSTLPLVILVVTSATPTPLPRSSATGAPLKQPAQPPPLSSLPLSHALKPSLGPTYTYLVDISLLLLPAEPLFGPVAGTEHAPGIKDGKDGRDVKRFLVEVGRNKRGRIGGLVGFLLEGGVKLDELHE